MMVYGYLEPTNNVWMSGLPKIFACQVKAIPASTLLSKDKNFKTQLSMTLRPNQNLQTSLWKCSLDSLVLKGLSKWVLISPGEQQRAFWEEESPVCTIMKSTLACIISLTVQDTMQGKKQQQSCKTVSLHNASAA